MLKGWLTFVFVGVMNEIPRKLNQWEILILWIVKKDGDHMYNTNFMLNGTKDKENSHVKSRFNIYLYICPKKRESTNTHDIL